MSVTIVRHRVSADDCLPCNFEELQNLLQCIRLSSLASPHSWQEADFLMPFFPMPEI